MKKCISRGPFSFSASDALHQNQRYQHCQSAPFGLIYVRPIPPVWYFACFVPLPAVTPSVTYSLEVTGQNMAQELQYHPCLSTTLTVKNECQK